MVELLVAGVEGLQFFTNEFIKNAPVDQSLTQLSDLRPVVPGVAERALQGLVGRWEEETGTSMRTKSRKIEATII